MSAPWIKVEHITPDKPEIVELAEYLKIDQDAAFGKCVRIWIWADQQSVDGDRLSVTPSFLDRLTNCPGFSEGLRLVGWLKSRNDRFSIPNFSRLNGQSAKKRALTQERVEKSRNAKSVTETLPEIEIDKRKKRERVKTTLSQVDPGNFLPGEADPPNIQATADRLKKTAEAGLTAEEFPLLADPAFLSEWEAWLEVRKRKKAVTTEHALRLAMGKITGLQIDEAIAVVQKSVIGGYTGLFPEEKRNGTNRQNRGGYVSAAEKREQANAEFLADLERDAGGDAYPPDVHQRTTVTPQPGLRYPPA